MASKKLLLVAFDVPKPKPGDRRHKETDELLSSMGTVTRVLKQIRLLQTAVDVSSIPPRLTKVIGSAGAVLVVTAAKRFRLPLGKANPNQQQRAEIRDCRKRLLK